MKNWLFSLALFCLGWTVLSPAQMTIVVKHKGATAACTPVSGYAHCRVLTIDHTQVGVGDSSYWPLVTQNSSGAMDLGASKIQNASCYDVVFTSDSGGTTLIPWQIESCVSQRYVTAHVKIGTLSHTTDTKVYVSYDNASISTAQNTGSYTPTLVWDSYFTTVWLNNENAANTTINDSTSTGDTATMDAGTTAAFQTAGQVDGSLLFNGGWYSTGATAVPTLLPDGAVQTLSAWAYPTTASEPTETEPYYLPAIIADSSGFIGIVIGTQTAALANCPSVNDIYAYYYDGDFKCIGAGGYAANTWYYLTLVHAGGTMYLYVNGAAPSTISAGTYSGWGALTSHLQYSFILSGQFSGQIDHAQVSKTARSADWITASYNNQKATSTFLTVGPEI